MAPHSFLGSFTIASLLLIAAPVLADYDAAPQPSSLTVAKASHCRLKKTVTSTVTVPYVEEVASVVVTTKISQYTQPPGGPAPIVPYDGPAWLPIGTDLRPALKLEEQSGNCPLGTFDAPTYGGPLPGDKSDYPWGETPPPWTGNPPPSHGGGYPGGHYPDNGTHGNGTDDCVLIDPSKPPLTGKTRKYNFELSYRQIAPDGVSKQGLVINGGFPGPTIEANWGDWIEVTVKNNLGSGGTPEGTSIHWHGLLQKETPFMDGVPSVSQCPISPGDTFTYRFRADQYGSSCHYSAQYSGGIYGAMIIHGPNDSPKCAGYDEDLGPVLVGDWYHDNYFALVNKTMNGPGRPQSQSNLVNGRANYPCQNTTKACIPNAGLSKFKFKSGKKYRLRLINPSSEALQKISIDGHKFKVIANDFVPVVPYETDLITLGVGQRTDVIVEATGDKKSSYWFRSTLQANGKSCSLTDGIASNATAVIYYEDASPNAIPTSKFDIAPERILQCRNDPLNTSVPLFPISSDTVGDVHEQVFNIDLFNNGTHNIWGLNNISARIDFSVSQLYEASKGTLNPKKQWNLYTLPQSASYARVILYNSFPFAGHPMHLHGHNFQVLAIGNGVWDGKITNPENPTRRDVIELPAALPNNAGRGYTVIQFELDNPALNILHCHLAWHVSAGLYAAFVEKPEDIRKISVPAAIPEGCKKWAEFSETIVLEQIDSGL